MTLVSAANIMDFYKLFIVGGEGHLCILQKAKALELTLGKLHDLLSFTLRRKSEYRLMILF
jgi:hypothetical protein